MWDVEMAKLFKERENKATIGNVIGKVISSSPLKISILDGMVVLEKEELYMSKGLSLVAGNEVLLIPAENEQVFFIINVFQKVGG